MRKSRQRELILEIINHSYDHPTAYMIYEKCQHKIPNISLGTVYRNLNSLVNDLKIKRIKTVDSFDRYDRIDDFHAHFMCFECMQIFDLNFSDNLLQKEFNGNKISEQTLNCDLKSILIEALCFHSWVSLTSIPHGYILS